MWRPNLPRLRAWLRAEGTPPPAAAPRWLVAACYVGFPLLSALVVLVALRITSVETVTRAPLLNYDDGDVLLILPIVKDAVERGNYYQNDRLGAPGAFQIYDFPVIDYTHLLGIWLVGQCTDGSYVTAFNVYYLLTFPLTTLTAFAVFRWFGFSLPGAGAGGLLYAFLYWHAIRGQAHYFLSAYWGVPLSLMLVLRVCRGDPPFTEARDGGRRWAFRRRDSLCAAGIAALTALGGAYYAFFTCALLGFAAVYGSLAARSWKPALAAGVLLAVISAAGVAAHAPTIVYQAKHGRNPIATQRLPIEAELYGLKIAPMLLPQFDHQWPAVGRFAAAYHEDGRPLPSENRTAVLGVVASAGVIGVGVVVLLPGARRWPYGPLGALVVFATLFATIGGLGSLFNFFVSSQVRAYSRMSVFIAFFGLFAALWALDRWLGRWPVVRCAAFGVVAVLGVLDQTPRPWFRPEVADGRKRIVAQFDLDAGYFAEVEAAVPGGTVFALPHISYPENIMRHRMSSAYRHVAGYLHTRTVRWSFGSMKGREVNEWHEEVAADPAPRMAQRLVAGGFDAVCVDVFGYTEPDGEKVVAEMTAVCGPPILRQADGSRLLFDLRPLRARALKDVGEAGLDRNGARDREAVRLMFRENFIQVERDHFLGRVRGVAVLRNPTDRTRAVRIGFRHAWGEGLRMDEKELSITSAFGWDETIREHGGEWSDRAVTVPPGEHRVTFRCPRAFVWFDRMDPRACLILVEVRVTEP